MYTRQTAEELETSPARAGDDGDLLIAQQICAKLGDLSLMTPWRWLDSDLVRFPPTPARTNNRRYGLAGNTQHSPPADRTVGAGPGSGSRKSVIGAGSLEHSILA